MQNFLAIGAKIQALVAGLFARSSPDGALMRAIKSAVGAALAIADQTNSRDEDIDKITAVVLDSYEIFEQKYKLDPIFDDAATVKYVRVLVEITYDAALKLLKK